MRKTSVLQVLLIVEAVALLVNAAALFRDYQDSWILEGLEIPFAVFVVTYIVYVLLENRLNWLAPFILIFRATFFLIPSLKYPWFQGVGIDQAGHYGLIHDIYNVGYIRTDASFQRIFEYSGTPGMHLVVVTFSRVTAFSPVDAFKYLPFALWLIYPLAMLALVKRIAPKNKFQSIAKYALIFSSIPFDKIVSYAVVGTTIGLLLVFLFLSQLTKVMQTSNRKDWFVALLFAVTLIITHSYSSILMMIGLLVTYLIFRFARRLNLKLQVLNTSLLILIVSANIAWLIYHAQQLYSQLTGVVTAFMEVIFGNPSNLAALTGLYPRFFELNLFDEIKIILLYYGAIIFLLFFTLAGVLLVIKKFRNSNILMFLSLYVASVWLFGIVQIVSAQGRASLLEYARIPLHTAVLAPIFGGIVLSCIDRRIWRKIGILLIIITLVVLATIQLYNPPQLVPSANAINKNLPSDIPLVYVNNVNSAYQRYLVEFAERSISQGTIASDEITRIQVVGLANYTFTYQHMLRYYPFSRLLDKNITQQQYDYFLIHVPGISGSFQEKAEIRTPSLILEAVNNSNVLYTNGESYILGKPFFYNP